MKAKLFGLFLMLVGAATFVWIAIIILLTKGMLALIYGAIPLVAGWLIFHSASKEESPKQTTEKESLAGEIKSGVGRLRSFLKGLL